MEVENTFKQWKKQCLNKIDFSKKGSVDEDITNIVSVLNDSEKYFTTSSCSGRIIVIDGGCNSYTQSPNMDVATLKSKVSDCLDVQKQNCSWLFVTHQKCQKTDLVTALERSCGDVIFKFEPFILHVQCRQLGDAQLLHSVAVESGFRNSGITVGKKGKIIMAVRSTHCLEVPLSRKGQVLVSSDYIEFLVEVANQKMIENLRRIERFFECLQSAMHHEDLHCTSSEAVKEKSVYKRRRKRTQDSPVEACQSSNDATLSDEDNGLQNGMDLFT
ncbi:tRNA wybutosine-synthesizing protein 3 homolog isoform X1 [Conger conger]|uniref:tRNA wybutosine-synthesizing protein 3 homolog isoform X1 n=1 Tax=Conger conger TaxID=82655 RepID=UPI002A5AD3B8|nr:tRNA wybutosine-synthesizing protein 3 homolog isoform X1 [Conger conger]